MLAQEIKELSEAKTEKWTTQEIQNFEDVKLSNVFLTQSSQPLLIERIMMVWKKYKGATDKKTYQNAKEQTRVTRVRKVLL